VFLQLRSVRIIIYDIRATVVLLAQKEKAHIKLGVMAPGTQNQGGPGSLQQETEKVCLCMLIFFVLSVI
jgi:hypothetical protein